MGKATSLPSPSLCLFCFVAFPFPETPGNCLGRRGARPRVRVSGAAGPRRVQGAVGGTGSREPSALRRRGGGGRVRRSAACGGRPARPFEPCRVPSRRPRPWACGERMCVSASRLAARVASGPKAASGATQPYGRALAGLWRQPGPPSPS